MATTEKIGFMLKELVFVFTLQVLCQEGDATGFIVAKSCREAIGQSDPMTFPPGRAVWMQVVSATFVVSGPEKALAMPTSSQILQSTIPGGGSCNVTPFKTIQVMTSPDNIVRIKDPISKKFICIVANAALTLREATGYISCETNIGTAEIEIDDLIKATDFFVSMLLNVAPRPATTISAERETSMGNLSTQIREKRQHYAAEEENMLHSENLLQYNKNTTNSSEIGFVTKNALNFVSTQHSLQVQRFYTKPQPTLIIQDISQTFLSTTSVEYVTKETETRPLPKPSIYDGKFSENSSAILMLSSMYSELKIDAKPTESFSLDNSPSLFSEREIPIESVSDLLEETTMILESVVESMNLNSYMEPEDYITESFLEQMITITTLKSTNLGSTIDSIMMSVRENDLHSLSHGAAVVVSTSNVITGNFNYEQNTPSYLITPTKVLENNHTNFVSGSSRSSFYHNNELLTKTSRTRQKPYSTNEDIQDRIMGFLSSFSNYFQASKGTSSQGQNSSRLVEVMPELLTNHTFTGEQPSAGTVTFSSFLPSYSSKVTPNVSPKWIATKLSEIDTSLITWSVAHKSVTEPSLKDNEKLSWKAGTLPNEVLTYISSKTNSSLSKEKRFSDLSLSSSISQDQSLSEFSISHKISPESMYSSNAKIVRTYLPTTHQSSVDISRPLTGDTDVDVLGVLESNTPHESGKSRNTWLLFVGGAIALQIQLILGLTIIWCCLRRRFKRYVDTESPATIYDGFSKVVNFRNSGKLGDETERFSVHDDNENTNDSTSKVALEVPKCLTTSL